VKSGESKKEVMSTFQYIYYVELQMLNTWQPGWNNTK